MKTLHSIPNWEQAKDEGAAPLSGPGFGGHFLNPENLVVICLGNGGVRFVASRRADAFIFKVDPCRRIQMLFQERVLGPGAMVARC